MSIVFDPNAKIFSLCTAHSSYQMQIGPLGYLLHLYYGRRVEEPLDYLHLPRDCGFSANPYELQEDRGWSLDTMPQEYSGSNAADFRLASLSAETENGVRGADLRYLRHEIRRGKYAIPGLPSADDRDGDAETLSVTLLDQAAQLEVELLYAVYPKQDAITRAVNIINCGAAAVKLEKAASLCLDLPFGNWDLMHFHGRHTLERQPERAPVADGIQTVSSRRGASSHQHNPFLVLCEHAATEDAGDCCGVMLAYSGSFRMEAEKDQTGSVRVTAGIQDEGFSWRLAPGERFTCPEVILSFSASGLTPLSQCLHRFLRHNICRGKWAERTRPVLLNTWEAAYFDFDAQKILQIARNAKALGVELLVLDDGWFGERNDDRRSLGDWFANEKKLPGGLRPLVDEIHGMGLLAGLWVEPEMVSENSELFRAHPDWALSVPGRRPTVGRNQLVLDLSRTDVVDWLTDTFTEVLKTSGVDYVKWDMNRHLSDLYSAKLPADRQGELAHRYVLGLYTLLERLTSAFPEILFEGCAGGGGRFDAGMLYYCPQIWCSDNTDPIARLRIQHGTSFGYPICTMGAHVSASPNHQTGRSTPLGTRCTVAMAGTFGYELDPGKLNEAEKEEIRQQIRDFRRWQALIQNGDYYRLTDEKGRFVAWEIVSPDRREALMSLVMTDPEANPRPLHLRLKGLEEAGRYRLAEARFSGCPRTPELPVKELGGAALMYAGLTLPPLYGDYPSVQIYLSTKTEET